LHIGDDSMEKIDISKLPVIGSGTHGSVYRLDENRCIKICEDIKDMQMEYRVLKYVEGYRQFPKVYECKNNYMIHEYVGGQDIKTYIEKNGFDYSLATELTELLKLFIKLKFTRIDIRMHEVFINEDHKIKIIDTTRYLDKRASYPQKMLRSLRKLGLLEQYMNFLKINYPEFYKAWKNELSLIK